MKTKITSIAVAAIVLTACAGAAQSQTPGPRTTKVEINTGTAERPLIWIDQEPIIVRSQKVRIEWQIATEGYEFPKDGIVFTKAPPDEFVCGVDEKDRRIFACVDRNSQGSTSGPVRYKYTIKVQPAKGAKVPQPPRLDPSVWNDR